MACTSHEHALPCSAKLGASIAELEESKVVSCTLPVATLFGCEPYSGPLAKEVTQQQHTRFVPLVTLTTSIWHPCKPAKAFHNKWGPSFKEAYGAGGFSPRSLMKSVFAGGPPSLTSKAGQAQYAGVTDKASRGSRP